VTQFPTYHDLVAANIISPDDVTAILEYCDSNYDYVAIADPPGAGPEHFAAKAEAYRAAEASGAVRVGTAMAFPRAALRLDATPAKPRRQRKPRKPTLASVAKQASKAGIDVARYEVKPDGTVVVVAAGKPAPVEPENPWPLDEFRTKETKQ
jgi:hypothetical protein